MFFGELVGTSTSILDSPNERGNLNSAAQLVGPMAKSSLGWLPGRCPMVGHRAAQRGLPKETPSQTESGARNLSGSPEPIGRLKIPPSRDQSQFMPRLIPQGPHGQCRTSCNHLMYGPHRYFTAFGTSCDVRILYSTIEHHTVRVCVGLRKIPFAHH